MDNYQSEIPPDELTNAISSLIPEPLMDVFQQRDYACDKLEIRPLIRNQIQVEGVGVKDVCKNLTEFTFYHKKSKINNEKVYVCSLCEAEFPTTEAAVPHMNIHTVQCGNCLEIFATGGQLWTHLRKNHIPKAKAEEHLCDHCGDVLNSEHNLELHIKKNHEVGISSAQMPFTCVKCGDKFSDWDSVRIHLGNHTEKDIPCENCGLMFSNKAMLWEHYCIVHLDAEKRTFMCTSCGNVFKTERDLFVHESRHLQVKSFQCDQCSRSFPRRYNLEQHVKKLHSKRIFTCEYCGKVFDKLVVHNSHVTRVHVNKGKHVCDVCSEPFENKEALVIHRFTHENIVYECRFCKMQCSNRYNLRAHERNHTNQAARHTCKLCPMRFYKKISLTLHVESVHDNERVES